MQERLVAPVGLERDGEVDSVEGLALQVHRQRSAGGNGAGGG
jgi:hypothetical protein